MPPAAKGKIVHYAVYRNRMSASPKRSVCGFSLYKTNIGVRNLSCAKSLE